MQTEKKKKCLYINGMKIDNRENNISDDVDGCNYYGDDEE